MTDQEGHQFNVDVLDYRLKNLEDLYKDILKQMREMVQEMSLTFMRADNYRLEKFDIDKQLDDIRADQKDVKERAERFKLWMAGVIVWPVVVALVAALAYRGFH